MGEGQILAQVKQVYKVRSSSEKEQSLRLTQVGQNCIGFGRHLNGLLKQAITAGKRVRNETSICSGAVSVSSAAAELAQIKLPTHNFDDANVNPPFPKVPKTGCDRFALSEQDACRLYW